MSKVYGVKCDRCGEVLTASSASKLAEDVEWWGWTSRKFGRSFVHHCEPCEELNEDLRRAIMAKLAEVAR